MSEKDKGNLYAIVESCSKIEKFIDDIWDADALFADEKTFDAVNELCGYRRSGCKAVK